MLRLATSSSGVAVDLRVRAPEAMWCWKECVPATQNSEGVVCITGETAGDDDEGVGRVVHGRCLLLVSTPSIALVPAPPVTHRNIMIRLWGCAGVLRRRRRAPTSPRAREGNDPSSGGTCPCLPTTMLLSRLAPLVLLLPFVSADVHKLKLKKLAPAATNPALESAYLAEKYGGAQTPLMGAGIGRDVRLSRPSVKDGEELFWTQDEFTAEGGHNVPLSSKCHPTHLLVGQS